MMRFVSKSFLIFGILFFLSCSDGRRTSTEVENELQVSAVSGIAATGYAMANAAWQLMDSAQQVMAQGFTDSTGRLFSSVALQVAQGDVWILQVHNGIDTLRALVTMDSIYIQKDSLFALVNPVTHSVAKLLLQDSTPLVADSLQAKGQMIVKQLFGDIVNWNQFANDKNYRAAMEIMPAGYIPNITDMILHSLANQANMYGVNQNKYLDSLYQASVSISNDAAFQYEMASNMALFGLPPEQAGELLDHWDPEVQDHYVRLRQFEYENGGEDSVRYVGDSLLRAMDLANQTMQRSMVAFQGEELLQAQKNFSIGVKILADVLLDEMNGDKGKYYSPAYWDTMAKGLGFAISSLKPSSWASDSLSVLELMTWIVDERIQPAMDSSAVNFSPPDGRVWCQEGIPQISKAFSADPLRPAPVQ